MPETTPSFDASAHEECLQVAEIAIRLFPKFLNTLADLHRIGSLLFQLYRRHKESVRVLAPVLGPALAKRDSHPMRKIYTVFAAQLFFAKAEHRGRGGIHVEKLSIQGFHRNSDRTGVEDVSKKLWLVREAIEASAHGEFSLIVNDKRMYGI